MRRMLALLLSGLVTAVTVPVLLVSASPAQALDNGLALTPQMGWNNWNTFGCSVNEELVRQTADLLVSSGMAEAGYEYVNIDDCWMERERDADGNLVADPDKFPSGMKALADYVHDKGLKLGIYSSAGTTTCAGYPASLGYEQRDADLWASWGIDYLKYDNCGDHQGRSAQERYTAMRDALAATGRPILYSLCNWGQENVVSWGAEVGNSWRTTGDITDDWSSVMSILDAQVGKESYSGPGAWNDPDMLEVGNPGLSDTESRAHFSLWSLLNAPLLAGNDLRSMSQTTVDILTNSEVIAVNQDWGGIQGHKISDNGNLEVWRKPMSDGSVATVLLNRGNSGANVSTTVGALGLGEAESYTVRDLWAHTTGSSSGTISAWVPAHGAAMYIVEGGGLVEPGASAYRGEESGRCLDVTGASQASGTEVVIWDCNGQANQSWTATGTGELRVYGDKCLDVSGGATANGSPVIIWDCNGGTNQQWRVNGDGSITAVGANKCLDVSGRGTANGTPVVIWDCNGQANQQWNRV
ncbi:lectin [Glycomyces tenuis]|uniref:lectin n=1 Tax=Glycomyces tenuis TaxID=58116 RepID=UPI00040C95AA|nr:lectin [Glycomyces tenuis]